ncbi:YHS domain-containing protein [Burkholderia contaminans]|uniref:YHS domain-containing protein n=1 Tax=Burkholderia contaminans TaxID=488447 RepID=UPI0014536787|nr:YHS domain-containing protein [Burkholderia contaminans]VWC92169.1 YHS domain-containing protein [Burkholderia contaminans]
MAWILNNLIWIGLLTIGILAIIHHQVDLWRIGRGVFGHRHVQDSKDLKRDPVSGNTVDPGKAITTVFNGKMFFFESETTCSLFRAHPERYTNWRIDRG